MATISDRDRRSTALLSVAIIFAALVFVQDTSGQSKIYEIVRRMRAHGKALTTLRAEVVIEELSKIAPASVARGSVLFSRNQKLFRIDLTNPAEVVSVSSGKYHAYRPDSKLLFTGKVENVHLANFGGRPRGIGSLMYLGLSPGDLRKNHDIALLSDNTLLNSGVRTFHLRFLPKTGANYKAFELWVDADGMLRQMRVLRRDDSSEISFLTKVEKNLKFNRSAFSFTWPRDTMLIDVDDHGLHYPNAMAESVLKAMERNYDGLLTMRADLLMYQYESQLAEGYSTSGVGIFAKRKVGGPAIRVDWQKPAESLSVTDGKYIFYRPRLAIAYTGSLTNTETFSSIPFLMDLLKMPKAHTRSTYSISYLGSGNLADGERTAILRIGPKKKASFKYAYLWVDHKGVLRQVKVKNHNGDVNILLLTSIVRNPASKPSDFQVHLPKSTKIHKS